MTSATLHRTQQLSATLFQVEFLPEKPIDFIPGQFIELILPNTDDHDERGHRRWFSVASTPQEQILSIITRYNPKASSSFKNQLFSLDAKANLLIADPMGDFVLPKDSRIPTIWIAAGVGIAPFISMARSLQYSVSNHSAHLFWTTSEDETLPHQTDFNDTLSTVFIADKDTSLTPDHITSQISTDTLKSGLFFIAGPEQFVERFIEKLATIGIPRQRLIGDFFHGYDVV